MEKFPQPESPEQIEAEIVKLLEDLDNYSGEFFDGLSDEMKDAWYAAEMDAQAGINRAGAKEELEKFLRILKVFKEQK